MLKLVLNKINQTLATHNAQASRQDIWNFIHRWDYEHTWTKNVLKFSNKILRAVNRYHIFRWDWMVGLVGCMAGFLTSWLEETYENFHLSLKPTVSQLVVGSVLKNDVVSWKLKDILNTNVFTNEEIQYFVHQALLNQVLNPQKQSIKWLITNSINSLGEPANHKPIAELVAANVNKLEGPIKTAALDFLNGEKMDSITANGLCSVLQSLWFKIFMAEQIKNALLGYLKDRNNTVAL